jgi:hypothetical protein
VSARVGASRWLRFASVLDPRAEPQPGTDLPPPAACDPAAIAVQCPYSGIAY